MRVKVWPWRRSVQVIVLLSLFAIPVLSRYSNYLYARQLDKLMERWDGSAQGTLLSATDTILRVGLPDGEGGVATRRPRRAILERAKNFYGSVWSARVSGLSLTDLLAGAESICASRSFQGVLLVGLAIPLVVTLLVGRVYCSWVCPMGLLFDLGIKVRALLKFLEIQPLAARLWKGNKYVLLGAGLLFGLCFGLPLLHYVYPPALLGREAHSVVTVLFERAEGGSLGLAIAGLTGASLLMLVLIIIDIGISPGLWCTSLCPGGALYSLVGRVRPLRVRRKIDACTECADCVSVCPRALSPMTDEIGMECDNCGLCVDVCEPRALAFRISLKDGGINGTVNGRARTPSQGAEAPKATTATALMAAVLLLSTSAEAHHILGIPHYDYDESYPQAPVLKLVENLGDWEVQLTGYPGNPAPGVRTQVNVYVAKKETRALYEQPVTLTVYRQPVLGQKKVVYGPDETALQENVYKFYPTYPSVGNYEVKLEFAVGQTGSTLRFPMVVGEPGSPWIVVCWFTGSIACFLIVIRAVRIKRDRRMNGLGDAGRQ